MSPDNRDILWDSDRSGMRAIWTMACDGTDAHQWSTADDPNDSQAPAWSPQGTRVAFVGATPEGFGVFVEPVDQSFAASRVTSLAAAPGNRPAWSNDGTRIAFAGGPAAKPDVYTAAPDGSHLHRLTKTRATDGEPAWSPDGKHIAFYSDRSDGDAVWVMDADGKHPRRLATSSMGAYQPAWSPDGMTLAYVRNSPGHSELWLMRADGTHQRALTHAAGHRADEAPSW